MRFIKFALILIGLALASSSAYADLLGIKVYTVMLGANVAASGTISVADTPYGLLITPNLRNLSPGSHGFQVHQNPSCANNGEAAGPHFDPDATNRHLGPYANGHLGDLPVLAVGPDGTATQPILAPRLTVAQLKGHSIIINLGGDNYSDSPFAGGGDGAAAIMCGVV